MRDPQQQPRREKTSPSSHSHYQHSYCPVILEDHHLCISWYSVHRCCGLYCTVLCCSLVLTFMLSPCSAGLLARWLPDGKCVLARRAALYVDCAHPAVPISPAVPSSNREVGRPAAQPTHSRRKLGNSAETKLRRNLR